VNRILPTSLDSGLIQGNMTNSEKRYCGAMAGDVKYVVPGTTCTSITNNYVVSRALMMI
jgi:hypothetical protein